MTVPREKAALVIPVYNRRETTLRALRSLRRIRTDGSEVKIFIVDDGSVDGTSEAISREFPEVQLIAGDGTLHYAGGTNLGILAALEWNPDYIVTMNDDAVFHEDFLVRLVETARRHPRSVVGALLLLWDKPHKVFQVGQYWRTFSGGWVIPENLTAFDVPALPFDVECIVGNCVLFPAAAIREAGLLDQEHFPHGWGDAQYLMRLRKLGWRLLIDPRALVWCEPNTYPPPLHSIGAAKALRILFRDELHPLNLKRQFVARWYSAPSKLAAVVAFIFYLGHIAAKGIRYGFGLGKSKNGG
ncbi:MAG: hypothetical protein C4325_09370 [Blastocatellia bacterium]